MSKPKGTEKISARSIQKREDKLYLGQEPNNGKLKNAFLSNYYRGEMGTISNRRRGRTTITLS